MKKYIYLLSLISTIYLSSCGGDKPDTNGQETDPSDTLKATEVTIKQIDSIRNIAASYWGLIEQADSTTNASVERLFLEISYNDAHDPRRLSELSQKLPAIKALSIKFDEIPHSDSIFAIDERVKKYLAEVDTFRMSTPGMEGYPLAQDLIDTIKHINTNLIVSLSGSYADHAVVYNALIDVYRTSLKEQGKNYSRLQLFYEPEANAPHYTKKELDDLLKKLEENYGVPEENQTEEPVM